LPQDKQSLPVQQLRAQLSRFAADNDRAHGWKDGLGRQQNIFFSYWMISHLSEHLLSRFFFLKIYKNLLSQRVVLGGPWSVFEEKQNYFTSGKVVWEALNFLYVLFRLFSRF
jgi:hypothetical protein